MPEATKTMTSERYRLIRLCSALAVGIACGASVSHAGERVRMTGPPPGQEAAKDLAGSLASSCNRQDFIGFMEHFTPRQAAAIRPRMEDLFTRHDMVMEIDDVVLLADGEETIVFAVRYCWHPKEAAKERFASRVTARNLGGQWKVDGERVKARSATGHNRSAAFPAPGLDDCGGLPPGWDPFNPPADLIDPELESLRGDIGIRPGRGCANGRCGVR